MVEEMFGHCPEMLSLTLGIAEAHGLAVLEEELFHAETEILRMQWEQSEREKL